MDGADYQSISAGNTDTFGGVQRLPSQKDHLLTKRKLLDQELREQGQGAAMPSPCSTSPSSASPQEPRPLRHPYSAGGVQPTLSSPALPSPPSSSQIFERNVQESSMASDAAPAIPTHIKTEDHIPPALEASSLAITDDHLDPDEVEIVTHAVHQPAASTLAENVSPSAQQSETHLVPSPLESQHESISAALHGEGSIVSPATTTSPTDDTASNYGSLDPNDVRRLSFISFADLVQAEHVGSGASNHMSSHASPVAGAARAQSPNFNRSPSPGRSPTSTISSSGVPIGSHLSQGIVTPPLNPVSSGAPFARGVELSPARSSAGSLPLTSASPPGHQHGELVLETMRQALRKTASGDLGSGGNARTGSAAGSLPGSAIGDRDDGNLETSF